MSLATNAAMMSGPDLAPPEPGDAQLAVSKINVKGRKPKDLLFAVLFLGLSVGVLGIFAIHAGPAGKVAHVVQLCAENQSTTEFVSGGTTDETARRQLVGRYEWACRPLDRVSSDLLR